MKKLIILLSMSSLIACSIGNEQVHKDYEVVSLLDYTTQEELDSKGLTPDRINDINKTFEMFGDYDYRYDGYHKYTINNNFDILVHPKKPDELYVVKNNAFLVRVNEPNTIDIYKEGAKFPNPTDTAIFFSYNQPSVMVAGDKEIYYDLNLDGMDVAFQIEPYKGEEAYLNYLDIPLTTPNYNDAIKANVPNQQCDKFYSQYACCLHSDGKTYQPYQFDYDKGWEKFDGKNAYKECNTD